MTLSEPSLLMSRVVDREDGPSDWQQLMTLAESDPTLWSSLAELLRVDALLRDAVGSALAVAGSVDVPAPTRPLPAAQVSERQAWRGIVRPLLGWAAAALVLMAWWWSGGHEGQRPAELAMVDGSLPLSHGSPELALSAVPLVKGAEAMKGPLSQLPPLERGEVLYEYPKTLVGTAPRPDGQGLEVLYIQRVLRREVVDDVYELARDELGAPHAIPVHADQLLVSDLL